MSDRAQRIALWTLAIALLVGTALALRYARGYRPLAGFGSGTPFSPEVTLRFEDVRVIGRYRGRRAWSVRAGLVESFRDRRPLTFSGNIQANVLDEGRVAATLSAPSASYDPNANALLADQGIRAVVRGRDKTTAKVSSRTASYDLNARALTVSGDIVCVLRDLDIRSDQLLWDAASNQAVCPGTVQARSPRGIVSGSELRVDVATRDYSIRNVRARFHVNPSGDLPF